MKRLFTTIILFVAIMHAKAQVQTGLDVPFNGVKYHLFIAKIDSETARKFEFIENSKKEPHSSFLQHFPTDSSFFLINAGTSNVNCKPLGYFQHNSVQKQAVNLDNGTGNFYLKPNGALLFTTSGIVVCESSEIIKYKDIRLGFQSGPMLVHQGVINKNFSIGSNNKNIRSGVGTFRQQNEDFVVFAVSVSPVSFHEFSEFFLKKFQCLNVLCLESAGCMIHFPNLQHANSSFNPVICNYLYYGF